MLTRRPAATRKGLLRVLYVVPGTGEGSSMVFARRQIASVERQGVVVDTFFLASRTDPRRIATEAMRLRRSIRDFRPDLVHAQFGTVTGLLAALVSSVPLVVTFRGSDINHLRSAPGLRSTTGRVFSQLAALRAERVVCVSERLRRQMWWRRERAIVQPNGTDLNLFAPAARAAARHALAWEEAGRVVLFNAGASPEVKRLDLAYAAVGLVCRSFPDVRLVTLGGEILPDRIPIYLNAADALLVTSDSEGSPNIVREALACNLPIVSVDVGDIVERIGKTTLSRIVARDVNSIAAGLESVLQTRRRSDGRSAMTDLSEERVARRLVELYREVCGRTSETG